ncbi:DJ-1/PfpI family protein [Streptomyces mobaraensis NBRC 13819 = DSM 40847]|uniref:DJ-1/PfpI family protein n=1 Tax=Streptomyces mobaraensis TaxID=35621 RepID=A0A5N5WDY8_STRMB|nr:DJ-1/PfpI family protein [Streptomyces mobaraensis]KAB7849999.1 DJ-1/PfpI family protein [Streptomyces mobaraensis]QTT73892.1 DJ-1/PfpI family protein [Streptomyces mobaraensis NBRC 13819 = DSM 40847]
MTSAVQPTRRGVLGAAGAGALAVGLTGAGGSAAAVSSYRGNRGDRSDRGDGRPADGGRGRTVAILLYDGFTALDAVGPYEMLCRLPGVRVVTVAHRPGPVRTDTGQLALTAERALADVRRADVLLVPGGGNRGTVATMEDRAVLNWVRLLHRRTTWTTSVCTGSLILGSAGLLKGLPATTYWASRPYLAKLGAVWTPGRFVEAGRIITAAGVSAGLDMGLHLAARLCGDATARATQLAVEYDPHPPFDSGSPEKADETTRRLALKLIDDAVVPAA